MLFFSILILLFFSLLIFFGILLFYSKEVSRRRAIFEEALWERRHRVPMLLEESGIKDHGMVKQEIIDIRAKLQNGAYTLEEQVELERQLTKLLKDFFKKTKLESDFLYISLEKEFSQCLENIRIAENDYNYAIQKWMRMSRLLSFAIGKNKPLEPI